MARGCCTRPPVSRRKRDRAPSGQALALWHRARRTLGELTLVTIVDRVLGTAAGKHPVVAAVRLQAGELSWDELRTRAASLPDGLAREALRELLVDWLTVVGNLTAEILTPALHETLRKVTLHAVEGEETP